MSADIYIEEAAKRVRDAVADLQNDIHTIQSEAYRTESQLHHEAASAENEAAEVKMELRLTADVGHKAALEARVRQLESEAHHKKDEATKLGADAARSVQAKTSVMNKLSGTVSQLESMAASVK